jgi:glycosyltransferase involved in cell wall biosynthesis
MKITVLVLTKNEEKAILNCLDALVDADQIILVDSNSTDLTVEIAKTRNVRIVNFSWNLNYPKKKQWSLELPEIENDWVLFLDADEIVSKELMKEIKFFLKRKDVDEYGAGEIGLDYYFLSRKLKYGHKVKKVALVNRRYCKFPVIDDLDVKNMWEMEGHYQPQVSKKIYPFREKISHLDPDPLYDYFARHNRYSDWEAYLLSEMSTKEKVANSRSRRGRLFVKVPFKPLIFFVYSYVLKSGWLDGRAGFNYSIALSFYYWQIKVKYLESQFK